MIRSWPAALLVPAVVLVGCGGDSEAEWQGTVRDSAGVEVVSNPSTGVWAPEGGWSVEQELVVGTAGGDPDYQFGLISGLDVDEDGRLYVMDQQARQIRIFSPDGEFLTSMGGAGSGPGEFSQAAGPLFVGPGDTISVPDMGQQRVTRYSSAGEPVGSWPIDISEGIPARWVEAPDQDVIQQVMVMQLPGQTEEVEPKNLLIRRGPGGEIEDTVLEMPIGKTVSFAGNQPSFTIFESEPMWTVGPDGRVVFGVNSSYRLEVFAPDGQLVRVIEMPSERKSITESDQAEYRRLIREAWQDAGMPPQAMEQMSQALSFAEFYPAFADIQGGPDGTLWVQGIQTPEAVMAEGGTFNMQDTGSAEWDVFDREGRLLGTVRMPPRFTPVRFLGDAIYGILRDELDVQHVARFRILRDTPAAG